VGAEAASLGAQQQAPRIPGPAEWELLGPRVIGSGALQRRAVTKAAPALVAQLTTRMFTGPCTRRSRLKLAPVHGGNQQEA